MRDEIKDLAKRLEVMHEALTRSHGVSSEHVWMAISKYATHLMQESYQEGHQNGLRANLENKSKECK